MLVWITPNDRFGKECTYMERLEFAFRPLCLARYLENGLVVLVAF